MERIFWVQKSRVQTSKRPESKRSGVQRLSVPSSRVQAPDQASRAQLIRNAKYVILPNYLEAKMFKIETCILNYVCFKHP